MKTYTIAEDFKFLTQNTTNVEGKPWLYGALLSHLTSDVFGHDKSSVMNYLHTVWG